MSNCVSVRGWKEEGRDEKGIKLITPLFDQYTTPIYSDHDTLLLANILPQPLGFSSSPHPFIKCVHTHSPVLINLVNLAAFCRFGLFYPPPPSACRLASI